MPEADFYFSGEKEQKEENLKAYIGEQSLDFQSLQKFSESDTELYYYIALDVSASYPKSEFQSICDALSAFGDTIRDQDHCVLVTFGDDVNIQYDLTGKELHKDGAEKEILADRGIKHLVDFFAGLHRHGCLMIDPLISHPQTIQKIISPNFFLQSPGCIFRPSVH